MKHDEAYELLAALSLDAVEANEREQIEAHVVECPRCRSELDALLEVAGAMGNSVEPLPEGLWTSISSRIYEVDDDAHPMPELTGNVVALKGAPSRRNPTWSKGLVATLGTVAAALIVVLAVSLAAESNHVNSLQRQLTSNSFAAAAALSTPGHTVVDLTSATRQELAEFVLLPDGRGYLVSSRLPTLASGSTYQLWGLINGTPISIGLMGDKPASVTFTVSGSKPTLLGITVEPSGGSPTPTGAMVASGTVAD
ncbi:MAG: anti-sigma factor [Acidimicrobiales bacterium]